MLAGCIPGFYQAPPQLLSTSDTDITESVKLQLDLKPFHALPGWNAGNFDQIIPVFLRSCEKIRLRPPNELMSKWKEFGMVADWSGLCDKALALAGKSASGVRYFLESHFEAYAVSNRDNPQGMFTGYYEAELRGSWQRNGDFIIPIYKRPDDLIVTNLGDFRSEWVGKNISGRIDDDHFIPYYNRTQISQGALSGRQLELMWVDSSIDAFFLHVQGSGRVIMDDGQYVRLGYAGKNGHRYVSIGRELLASGIIAQDEMSMQTIRKWMKNNPVAAINLMNKNPSYVFFQIMQGSNPIGAQGVELTPGISLAVDDDYVPYGSILWLNIMDPRDPERQHPLQRLVVAQDTGSAIKGAVRGDLFWGFGEEAAIAAGEMKEVGEYYILLPKTRTKP